MPKRMSRLDETLDRVKADYLADALTYVDPETGERRTSRFEPICDFCSQREPLSWSYPCGLVDLREMENPLMSHSNDDWAACEDCHALIEGDDIEGLITHMLVAVLGDSIDEMPIVGLARTRAEMRKHLARFTAARTGPAVREPTG